MNSLKTVSLKVKAFLQELLNRNPFNRPTPDEALKYAFIVESRRDRVHTSISNSYRCSYDSVCEELLRCHYEVCDIKTSLSDNNVTLSKQNSMTSAIEHKQTGATSSNENQIQKESNNCDYSAPNGCGYMRKELKKSYFFKESNI